MEANIFRFANAIFWVPLISIGVFTCIRVRSASGNGQFAPPIFFGQGPKTIAFRRKFVLVSIRESDAYYQKSRNNIARHLHVYIAL